MLSQLQSGEQNISDGQIVSQRAGRQGETICTELHGRFYEQAYRNRLFSFGLSNTALVAANAIATGLTATAQPVIGIFNPLNSGVNLAILQAALFITTLANSAVSPGGFMWLYSFGNAVTTGSTPISNGRLMAAGSQAKAFAVSTALTGLVNNLAVFRAFNAGVLNAAGAATAASIVQAGGLDNVDGSILVPPGGVVAVMNQVSTTTVNVGTSILWEEIPV